MGFGLQDVCVMINLQPLRVNSKADFDVHSIKRLKTEDLFLQVNGEEKENVQAITDIRIKGSRTSIVVSLPQ